MIEHDIIYDDLLTSDQKDKCKDSFFTDEDGVCIKIELTGKNALSKLKSTLGPKDGSIKYTLRGYYGKSRRDNPYFNSENHEESLIES